MSNESPLLRCYNRGCGKEYNSTENKEDSCTFHPGQPVFHDAYKGWSCCNKKSTDFTEFLNIKGCTKSYHSNVKPELPEKPMVDKSKVDEIIEVRAPVPQSMKRPPFETPLVELKADVDPMLTAQLDTLPQDSETVGDAAASSSEIAIGTTCKNSGCKQTYAGISSLDERCTYHTGAPIFHEGMKFWTCCNKRTSDFQAFLDQVGCSVGKHSWRKKDDKCVGVRCRYDWHQTGSHVVVSVFAKKYDPFKSYVKINPIRLMLHLHFPGQGSFDLDLELRGVVDVSESNASMRGTKLEVKLKKAEIGSWANLHFPKSSPSSKDVQLAEAKGETSLASRVDAVDLSDL